MTLFFFFFFIPSSAVFNCSFHFKLQQFKCLTRGTNKGFIKLILIDIKENIIHQNSLTVIATWPSPDASMPIVGILGG